MIEIVFFVLFIGPFFVKYFQYFYFLQLHGYTLNGIREEFGKKIFKNIFFPFWVYIEYPFFLMGIILFFLQPVLFVFIYTDLVFYYLMILNIYVLGKLFRGRVLKPRFDTKTIFGLVFFTLIVIGGFLLIASTKNKALLYIWILFVLSFSYIFIDMFYRIFHTIEKIIFRR